MITFAKEIQLYRGLFTINFFDNFAAASTHAQLENGNENFYLYSENRAAARVVML